jgi:hypothetical protein
VLIPVAVQFKAQVCDRSISVTAGVIPKEGINVCLLFLIVWVEVGPCDDLITRSEESYLACVCACVCVCVCVYVHVCVCMCMCVCVCV